jgi:hypothetical protein
MTIDVHQMLAAGVPVSPLTRLQFFDGLFLRAEHLRRNNDGLRNLTFLSNVADGGGVAFGLDASEDGDTLTIEPGLAIDGRGRVLLLQNSIHASITDLLDERPPVKKQAKGGGRFEVCEDLPDPPSAGVGEGLALYCVSLKHAESACGWEEVRGRTCEDACDASMERPYLVEHAHIHLCPLPLTAKLPTSRAVVLTDRHLQSRVASAAFADEKLRAGSLISGAGLGTTVWCNGAQLPRPTCADDEVPIALLARRGPNTLFLDPWVCRRERMDTPPRRYWMGRMLARPWDVFMAQVLQFQCQLTEALDNFTGPTGEPIDPCADTRGLVREALTLLEVMDQKRPHERAVADEYGIERPHAEEPAPAPPTPAGDPTDAEGDGVPSLADREIAHPTNPFDALGGMGRIAELRKRLLESVGTNGLPARILIDAGLIELPPTGYLRVDPHGRIELTRQVANLMGAGVDLRFCSVRTDQIAGEFESAQHLDRISLLRGLDDPGSREKVDILVPEGEQETLRPTGRLFQVDMRLSTRSGGISGLVGREGASALPMRGVSRVEAGPAGPFSIHMAIAGAVKSKKTADSTAVWLRSLMALEEPPTAPKFDNADLDLETLRRVAEETRGFTASRDTGATATRRTTFTKAAIAKDQEVLAGWLSFTADANPFTLAQLESAPFKTEFRWFSPTKPGHAIAVDAVGQYSVVERLSAAAVVVSFQGFATAEFDSERNSGPIEVTLRLELTGTHLRVVRVHRRGDSDMALEVSWSAGAPQTAIAEFDLGESLPFHAAAKLRESAEADDPGNLYHDIAANALTVLEGGHDDAQFAERAGALLFPTDAMPSGLRGRLDWVLFKRRTHMDCGGAAPAPPRPVEHSRVVAWQTLVDDEEHAKRLEEMTRGGQYDQIKWQRVGVAAFAGQTADLQTPADVLRAGWKAAGGGEEVDFGGYAGAGSAVQPAGTMRMRGILSALAPAAVPAKNARFAALPPPPAAYLEPGVDGAVFYISRTEAPAECARVYFVKSGLDSEQGSIRSGNEAGVAVMIDRGTIEDLGEARMENGYWQVGALPDRLQGGAATVIIVWVRPDRDPSEGLDFARQVIEQSVGVGPAQEEAFNVEFEGECPFKLFVFPVYIN